MIGDVASLSEMIVKRGLENVSVEDLVKEITPKGRGPCAAAGTDPMRGSLLTPRLVVLLDATRTRAQHAWANTNTAQVPPAIKEELLAKIRAFLAEFAQQQVAQSQ